MSTTHKDLMNTLDYIEALKDEVSTLKSQRHELMLRLIAVIKYAELSERELTMLGQDIEQARIEQDQRVRVEVQREDK
jgi:hypothetical protein